MLYVSARNGTMEKKWRIKFHFHCIKTILKVKKQFVSCIHPVFEIHFQSCRKRGAENEAIFRGDEQLLIFFPEI